MYKLIVTKYCTKKLAGYVKKDKQKQKYIEKCLLALQENPYNPILKSHKVTLQGGANVWSSKVTGDVRIIWNIVDGELIILILDIGGHSGKQNVYK
jgi:mRNA-degrading endonuclease YafQ of YafQ-DinJ toxin-antitoxin module